MRSIYEMIHICTVVVDEFTTMNILHGIPSHSSTTAKMNYFIYTSHHFTARENMNST